MLILNNLELPNWITLLMRLLNALISNLKKTDENDAETQK